MKTKSTYEQSPMIERVQSLPNFGMLRAAIENARPGERVHAGGLRGSALAFLAEALRARLDRPFLLVYPDGEAAEDAFSDLRTISAARAAHFPERDMFPHRFETKENLSVRGDRNEALLSIRRGETDVVVTSLLGYIEKTIPVASLDAHQETIRAGDTVDLEALRERLVSLGYDAVAVVEEAGQFAVRGAIIDVFDPSWDMPARIELFDEEVDSIRSFDLDSQRSVATVDAVTVLPAASVPFEEQSSARLRGYLSDAGFEGALIDRIEQEITHSRYSYLWRRYAPAMGMDGTLLDFFPEAPVIVFADTEAQNRSYQKLQEEMVYLAERAEDEYPMLALSDYTHGLDYHERFDSPVLHTWELVGGGDTEAAFAPVADGERVFKFRTQSHPSVVGKIAPLVGTIRKLRTKRTEVLIYSETPTQRERMAELLDEDEVLVHLPVGWITSGFIWPDAQFAVFTDHQIFNRILPRPKKKLKKRRAQSIRQESLQIGDFIVHVDYGIGRFVGLEKVGSNGDEGAECLAVRYHGGDKIYVPLEQLHLVEKYVGKEGVQPQMDRLGGNRWNRTKEKAKKSIENIAKDLLRVYAQRELAKGHACGPDGHWQRELEAAFPYEETPHQLRAIQEIKEDMESPHPMDRLICGDVGYGKTEVALRAAFKAVTGGKQVAVLVPTTLLAFQHFNTFKERMAQFPVRIEMLSRFVSTAGQNKVVADLREGTVDIVIGTHRILSKDVGFKDLGLLIVDEEHRFGVKHKERLKSMTRSVDVLSLTATPIPRTLYMSLSGLRKISVIDTPPRNRHPIKTDVVAFDEAVIQRAITDEIRRDGQVFFVHNRVRSIYAMQAFLERLLPGVKFCVGHGQMAERDLEQVVLDFMERKYDVLVSTMIIESGLDFPNVNTIIVNRADRFGLAQLYQLRGRVGRREQQAYAHFLIPRQLALTQNAAKRLEAMEEFEELGSGYRLAMRDLEIRGAGNVLGVEQHGHVTAIGFELYCKMLKEAVDALRGEEKPELPECKIEAPYRCYIPDGYVGDADERMLIYKRLAGLGTVEQMEGIESEVVDRFGEPPPPARSLLDLAAIRLYGSRHGVATIRIKDPRATAGPQPSHLPPGLRPKLPRGEAALEFHPGQALTPEQCGRLVETFGDRLLFKARKTFGIELKAGAAGLLGDVKNLLQVVYFSSTMDVPPDAN